MEERVDDQDRDDGEHQAFRYTPADAAAWHRDLLQALKAGEPHGFAKSMKDHFVGIHTRLGD